jgi:hypothetical protein
LDKLYKSFILGKVMVKNKKISSARILALTIILGIFISIMVIILVNLVIDYAYPSPEYDDFCDRNNFERAFPQKINSGDTCCNFSKSLQEEQEECYSERGQPVFEYDDQGCSIALKECDMCSQEFEDAQESYNRKVFFVFAGIGFILIVFGLFAKLLLLQLIALPAGASLVIESAINNFDDKLYVIIAFSLLIFAAIFLALKKLENFKLFGKKKK